MSKEEIDEHARKYSKNYSDGIWQKEFDEMAKKTVLKKLLKYMPLKTEFVRAVAQDETVKSFDGINADDIADKPNEFVEADFEVKEETGEVLSK